MPDKSSLVVRAGKYTIGWILLAAFFGSQTLLSYPSPAPPNAPPQIAYFAAAFCDWITWALLAPFIIPIAHRFPLGRDHWRRTVALHVGAAILFAVLKLTIRWEIGQLFPWIPTAAQLPRLLTAQLHLSLATYFVIAGAVMASDYYRSFREREMRATQLEARLAVAQLDALRTQLHPHFLFNTLHAISALVGDAQTSAANRAISRLSDLLRMTLDSANTHEIPLRRELEFIACYLELQQLRFEERLTVDLEFAPNTLDLLVPAMILQPIVENAIRHGISPRVSGGTLRIGSAAQDSTLVLTVQDDGPGLPKGAPEGVGLRNTRARLQQLYGARHSLSLDSNGSAGLRVTVKIPRQPASATRSDATR